MSDPDPAGQSTSTYVTRTHMYIYLMSYIQRAPRPAGPAINIDEQELLQVGSAIENYSVHAAAWGGFDSKVASSFQLSLPLG